MEPRVIVLEDDSELRALLRRGLGEEGFEVSTASTAAELLDRMSKDDADALVVDIGLPQADGRDVVQARRARGAGTPVLFLPARDALPDRLAGFAAGGDDYLTKPFAFAELVARLRALIRRGGTDLAVETGGLRLDPSTHGASGGGHAIDLTPTAVRLLAPLAAAPVGRVLRRRACGLAPGPNRPRQRSGRLYRRPGAQAHRVGRRARNRHRPRSRLLAAMRLPRLGVRTRLLLAIVGAVALALVVSVTAFGFLL